MIRSVHVANRNQGIDLVGNAESIPQVDGRAFALVLERHNPPEIQSCAEKHAFVRT